MALIEYLQTFQIPVLFHIDSARALIDKLIPSDKKLAPDVTPRDHILYHAPRLVVRSLEGAPVKTLDDKEMTYFTQYLTGFLLPHIKNYSAPTVLVVPGVETLEIRAQDCVFRFFTQHYTEKDLKMSVVLPVKNKEKISVKAVGATQESSLAAFQAHGASEPQAQKAKKSLLGLFRKKT